MKFTVFREFRNQFSMTDILQIPMSSGFESDLHIGAANQQSQGFSLKLFRSEIVKKIAFFLHFINGIRNDFSMENLSFPFRKPHIVIAHIAFKGGALFFYFFANFYTNSFIVQFLTIVSFFLQLLFYLRNSRSRIYRYSPL